MSSKNYSDLVKNCYRYIGCKDNPDEFIKNSCDKALKELEELSQFKYIYSEFSYVIPELNKEPYLKFLKGSSSYFIVATTLGMAVDKRIKQLSVTDMPYMIVFNSCAAAYLEYLADNYEDEEFKFERTFRFCPGYGGSSVKDLIELKKYIRIDKIGIQLMESGMMLPEKSMIGIIGKNIKKEKSCDGCVKEKDCDYRKENKTCYK